MTLSVDGNVASILRTLAATPQRAEGLGLRSWVSSRSRTRRTGWLALFPVG